MASTILSLKEVYANAGKAQDYFEGHTPNLPLYRCQRESDFKRQVMLLDPVIGKDIETVERDGKTFVKACLAMDGLHKGVSLFDKPVNISPSHKRVYKIASKTTLPDGLAVTRDGFNRKFQARHYTIAPKAEMPLELFIVSLKGLADACSEYK